MLKHIVFWKVCKDGTAEDRAAVIDTFSKKVDALRPIIPQIKDAVVAANINDGQFDVCIDSVFENKEELDAYIYHPEHLKVRAYMDSVSYDKTVFDYYF